MRLLFISNMPSPYRIDFFNELGKYVDLTVVFETMYVNSNRDSAKWLKGKTNYNYKVKIPNVIKLGKYPLYCGMKKILKEKYDLVIVGTYSTISGITAIHYLKRKKIDFIIEADGGMKKDGKGVRERIKRYLISAAKWYFSPSKITDEYLIFYGAQKDNIFRYPFTSLRNNDLLDGVIDSDVKKKLKEKLGLKETKVILSVGQIIYGKGFDLLLKSCAKLSANIGVYIVGGTPTNDLIEIKEKLDLKNVHFLEFREKEQLKEYYKAADLFVLPTRSDVWGLVINEAMANALPVITTDRCVAGAELIEKDRNGYIYEVNDIERLASYVNDLIYDQNKLYEMSQASLKIIKSYTIEKMVEKHLEAFNKNILKSQN